MKTLMLNRLFVAVAAAFTLLAGSAAVRAADDTMKFHGSAARDVKRSVNDGNGWCVVSKRQKVTLLEGVPPVDCLKYRVVVKMTASRGIDPSGIEDDLVVVVLGPETDWIAVELGMPTTSGPSLKAAKAANEVVGKLDEALPVFEALLENEKDPKVRAEGARAIGALKKQRAALVDLIQKDVEAIGTLMK
jgi:hypothetical protein